MNRLNTENWVQTKTLPRLEGVKTFAAHFVAERAAPRHLHHEYVFGLVSAGAMRVDCGHCSETHVLAPGDLLLTEPDQVYRSRALGKPPWRYFSVSVSKEKLASLLDDGTGKPFAPPHFAGGAIKNKLLRQRFLKLQNSLNDEQNSLESESCLLDWVVSVIETYADKQHDSSSRKIGRETTAVRRVREFIRENVAENIRLQDLTEIAGLSAFHLNRAFRRQIGLPPHEFQTQLRIEQAANLIRQKTPLADIAAALGFADQSHFNRFFKRYTGVTPRRFIAQ